MNILFTSVGRRYSLIESFKVELKKLAPSAKIIATDLKSNAPALFLADVTYQTPRVSDPEYLKILKKIVKENQVKLIVPLIDTELCLLSENQDLFESMGAKVFTSGPEVNKICYDKMNTQKFFQENNIPCPNFIEMNRDLIDFPYFLKPARGSCSIGAVTINDQDELTHYLQITEDPIIQEKIIGREFTVDVLVLENKEVICAVPRERLETRAGEVSKGKTVRNSKIQSAIESLVSKLPDPFGLLTIQCFLTQKNEVIFIEINPRFGGGVPLAIAAGANFPAWIISWLQGSKACLNLNESWNENLLMLRYDDAIFINEKDIPSSSKP